jgi:hypothetical protein
MHPRLSVLGALLLILPSLLRAETYDVVIYGTSSAGITAAVQVKKMGHSVALVGPDKHLGGHLTGAAQSGDYSFRNHVGGLTREFYHRIWSEYQKPERWKWQKSEEFSKLRQAHTAQEGEFKTQWVFEPHVAEEVIEAWIRELDIPVFRNEWLDRSRGVRKDGPLIREITMLSGKSFAAEMFLDATYEGDLLAAAGARFHVGREANSVYGEKWNGVQVGVLHHVHHFGILPKKISPYRVPEDLTSGLLPGVSPDLPGKRGEGDRRLPAYSFRICATNEASNRIPFPRPAQYGEEQYDLLLRVIESGWDNPKELLRMFIPLLNGKFSVGNYGPVSHDYIGMNYEYPEASYERRAEMQEAHRSYQQGLLYFLANSPSVPGPIRESFAAIGLCRDEFVDSAHWPPQLTIREARRLSGRFVMTEHEIFKPRGQESVGIGGPILDCHNTQRYITPDDSVQNEGDLGVKLDPYPIVFGSLLPKPEEVSNLLVPVCVSSSHSAYTSIRMEPVLMVLGQSAATAACLAIEQGLSPHALPYPVLRQRLIEDKQILQPVTVPQRRLR